MRVTKREIKRTAEMFKLSEAPLLIDNQSLMEIITDIMKWLCRFVIYIKEPKISWNGQVKHPMQRTIGIIFLANIIYIKHITIKGNLHCYTEIVYKRAFANQFHKSIPYRLVLRLNSQF